MSGPLTPAEAEEFRKGELDLDGDLFDRLYAYYTNPALGVEDMMPYGTAKARSGDPYQWIEQQLSNLYE